jgi:hypothetical protein
MAIWIYKPDLFAFLKKKRSNVMGAADPPVPGSDNGAEGQTEQETQKGGTAIEKPRASLYRRLRRHNPSAEMEETGCLCC